MGKITSQIEKWSSNFGREYTDRSVGLKEDLDTRYKKRYGLSRTEMNMIFIGNLDRNIKILEVGSNTGNQLVCLQKMGFKNIYGIEIQNYAVELSKKMTEYINIIQGSAFDIPYKSGFFDLVFTAGVLIHISPQDLKDVMGEMYRCSSKFIWGFEYFSEELVELEYRDNDHMMWKGNYANLFLNNFSDLSVINQAEYKYANEELEDSMYLLKKGN